MRVNPAASEVARMSVRADPEPHRIGAVFQIESAVSVRIGRFDRLPPDRSARSERKLRIADRSRFDSERKGLAGSETAGAPFCLLAGAAAVAAAQSRNSSRISAKDSGWQATRSTPQAQGGTPPRLAI